MPEKQITQVFDAVRLGCQTSHEIAAVTDLPQNFVSSYLSQLADRGLIVRTHRRALRLRKGGPAFHRYAEVAP